MAINFLQNLSKIPSLPGMGLLSPRANYVPSEEEKEGYLRAQRLAFRATKEVADLLDEGWTEIQAAQLLNTYLKDSGVHSFFHHSFAWFGERCGFEGMHSYKAFMPSTRVILPGESFILDVAPIYRGYSCDIGYTDCLGENPELKKAQEFLARLKKEIPAKFQQRVSGSQIWNWIDEEIKQAGYTNAYIKYPFSVLGHRVHKVSELASHLKVMNFGWQSYWSLVSRGLFGQLLNRNFSGDLTGLWAIEPHLSGKTFGAKFEELLVVTENDAYWLERNVEE
jgi:Xaa-Pro aminopeptidase